jgi:predicted nucleic acid-binding protein
MLTAEPYARAAGGGRRAGAMDAIVAETAFVQDLEVWAQDDDFGVLAELYSGLRVVVAEGRRPTA